MPASSRAGEAVATTQLGPSNGNGVRQRQRRRRISARREQRDPQRSWRDGQNQAADRDGAGHQFEDRGDAHPAPPGKARRPSRAQAVAAAYRLGLVRTDVEARDWDSRSRTTEERAIAAL